MICFLSVTHFYLRKETSHKLGIKWFFMHMVSQACSFCSLAGQFVVLCNEKFVHLILLGFYTCSHFCLFSGVIAKPSCCKCFSSTVTALNSQYPWRWQPEWNNNSIFLLADGKGIFEQFKYFLSVLDYDLYLPSLEIILLFFARIGHRLEGWRKMSHPTSAVKRSTRRWWTARKLAAVSSHQTLRPCVENWWKKKLGREPTRICLIT